LSHRPLFSFANVKYFRRNILGHQTSNPRRMPKRCLATIAKGYVGCGLENLHIFRIARVASVHPNLFGAFPFKPRPTQTKSRGKLA
jgi:hypothetical protein